MTKRSVVVFGSGEIYVPSEPVFGLGLAGHYVLTVEQLRNYLRLVCSCGWHTWFDRTAEVFSSVNRGGKTYAAAWHRFEIHKVEMYNSKGL